MCREYPFLTSLYWSSYPPLFRARVPRRGRPVTRPAPFDSSVRPPAAPPSRPLCLPAGEVALLPRGDDLPASPPAMETGPNKRVFDVQLDVQELLAVPDLAGIFHVKAKAVVVGLVTHSVRWRGFTADRPVEQHRVVWNEVLRFRAVMGSRGGRHELLAPYRLYMKVKRTIPYGRTSQTVCTGELALDLSHYAGIEGAFATKMKLMKSHTNAALRFVLAMRQVAGSSTFQRHRTALSILSAQVVSSVMDGAAGDSACDSADASSEVESEHVEEPLPVSRPAQYGPGAGMAAETGRRQRVSSLSAPRSRPLRHTVSIGDDMLLGGSRTSRRGRDGMAAAAGAAAFPGWGGNAGSADDHAMDVLGALQAAGFTMPGELEEQEEAAAEEAELARQETCAEAFAAGVRGNAETGRASEEASDAEWATPGGPQMRVAGGELASPVPSPRSAPTMHQRVASRTRHTLGSAYARRWRSGSDEEPVGAVSPIPPPPLMPPSPQRDGRQRWMPRRATTSVGDVADVLALTALEGGMDRHLGSGFMGSTAAATAAAPRRRRAGPSNIRSGSGGGVGGSGDARLNSGYYALWQVFDKGLDQHLAQMVVRAARDAHLPEAVRNTRVDAEEAVRHVLAYVSHVANAEIGKQLLLQRRANDPTAAATARDEASAREGGDPEDDLAKFWLSQLQQRRLRRRRESLARSTADERRGDT